jgi:hypothetical protein
MAVLMVSLGVRSAFASLDCDSSLALPSSPASLSVGWNLS